MKKMIFASVVMLALVACSDSDSTSCDGCEFSCDVTRNANSVVWEIRYRDFSRVNTVTLNSNGNLPYHTERRVFPTAAIAERECQKEMDRGYYTDIECYGKTIDAGEPAADFGLDYWESFYRTACADLEDQYKNGLVAKEYNNLGR